VKAGDAGQIPPGVPHSGCTMASPDKVLVTFVVGKGKPFMKKITKIAGDVGTKEIAKNNCYDQGGRGLMV
jgi:hypothetical protein